MMLEKSLGLLFFLRKPSPFRPGPWLLTLRITVDGIEKEMSLKRSWPKERWDRKANRASGNKEDAKTLNTYIDVIQNKAYQAKTSLIEQGRPVTAVAIRDILSGAQERKRKLLLIFYDHNKNMEKLVKKGEYAQDYLEKFQRIYEYVKDFLIEEYKVPDIAIQSLDYEFASKFYTYLRSTKNCAHNTSIKYFTMFKKVILECVKKNWLLKDPFASFETSLEQTDPTFLTEHELETIANKKMPSERLEQMRDIYIFCCLTALAFIDVKQLKRSEVTVGVDGNLWIDKRRQKSKVPAKVPLLPTSLKILEKYKNHPQCVESGYLLPVSSNSKYNDYLKEIAAICGIDKNLTTHTARHTFGTTVTAANGVPLQSVKGMMGHKRIQQTEHYSKLLPVGIASDMKVLQKNLKKKKFLKDYDDSL